jgi:alpha-glutamyl/putrescinyl thymine pyrophosphorylase clade 1
MRHNFRSHGQLDLTLGPDIAEHGKPSVVSIGRMRLRTTPVFDAYWRFAAERQKIFFRRVKASSVNDLTEDAVLKQYKFTNAYRASDRVSQYLIRSVIYRDDLSTDRENVFFRILLFKVFNKIETWKALETALGSLTYGAFNIEKYDRVLSQRMAKGERVYSAAYIMPSGRSAFGATIKHRNHLRMIAQMMREGYAAKLADCETMKAAFELMLKVPSVGPFLAFQYVIDLNYSTLTNFSEAEFVVAGPGALDGISKCFLNADDVRPEDVISYMYENQDRHFGDLNINFLSLWGRKLQLIDCQNIFCEISKYARVTFPEHAGISGRTRIKQKFSGGNGALPPPWYPPKWHLNEKIASDLA